MNRGFWDKLNKPIIGLSPMDGVTDAAFRYITDKYSQPDVLFTEFTSVEGIAAGADKLLSAFVYHKSPTPIVGQIFGSTPDDFYKSAFVLAELGFDGIDINMGCPDPHVAKKGGGAGLIKTPELAREIIIATQKGSEDWASGIKIEKTGLPKKITNWIKNYKEKNNILTKNILLPVSVKTRIGYDEIVTESWIETLLTTKPANITLHGRTLKQLYSGEANWEEISKAAKLAKDTTTTLLGNGDIKSMEDALEKITHYKTDGALIGRAAFGKPEIFSNKEIVLNEKLKIAIEHCEAFEKLTPELNFLSVRKHLAWYCKGFDNASDKRMALMMSTNSKEVRKIIEGVIK